MNIFLRVTCPKKLWHQSFIYCQNKILQSDKGTTHPQFRTPPASDRTHTTTYLLISGYPKNSGSIKYLRPVRARLLSGRGHWQAGPKTVRPLRYIFLPPRFLCSEPPDKLDLAPTRRLFELHVSVACKRVPAKLVHFILAQIPSNEQLRSLSRL